MSSVWPYHFSCGVVLLLVFHGFILVCFFLLPLCFEGLGDWLGRRKLMELRDSPMIPDR